MLDDRLPFPFARPAPPAPAHWIPRLEASYRERWHANRGPLVRRLERQLPARDTGGGRHAALVSSATAGIVATLLALGVRGRVAVPAFTFPASAHAIHMAGCEPVLCDVDPDTWELDPTTTAQVVRDRRCAAILHVRAFGLCRDLTPMEAVAADLDVPLVIDAAAAYGGIDAAGRAVGRAGAAEIFSFHATKVFSAGEGGVVLADEGLAERIRHVSNFALDAGDVTMRGMNAKMSETTAAVALAMLDVLDDHMARREDLLALLREAVSAAGLPATEPAVPGRPPWQGLPLLCGSGAVRARALEGLRRAGVEGRAYYAPGLHRTRAFGAFAQTPLSVTDHLAERMLCLPLYSDLDEADETRLRRAIERGLASASREEPLAVPGR